MKAKTETRWIEGGLYTTDGKNIFRLVKYIPEPQISMMSLEHAAAEGRAEIKMGLESEFSAFVALVPATDPPMRQKRKYERKKAVEAKPPES